MQTPRTYSFQDTHVQLIGPGCSIQLGNAGNAEGGISYEFVEETDTMHIGADGTVAHSLHASRAAKLRIRLLKTSPTNAILQQAYNYQRTSALFWGKNLILLNNPVLGDNGTASGVAFTRNPNNTYSKESGEIEWEFNAAAFDVILGAGVGN